MNKMIQDIWDLIGNTFKKSGDDDILTYSAAIAFYTIFSIAPLLVLFIYLGGVFLHQEVVLQQVQQVFGDFLEDSLIQNFSNVITGRIGGTAGIITTGIAILLILFGSTTVIMQLKTALNRIWNVQEIKMHSIKNFAFNRLLSVGMILIFTILLVMSLIAEAMLGIIGRFFVDILPAFEVHLYLISTKLGSAFFAILCFTLMFKILPDVHAPWKDIFVGAIVTTLLFLLGKYLIGYYFTSAEITATYRAAGSLIVFIIWIYYNILIVLLGAVFTQVYTDTYGGKIIPYRFVTLKDDTKPAKEPGKNKNS